jgi:hypothetical protein
MQGLNPLAIVSKGLDSLTLSLSQPPDPRTLKTPEECKEAYIRWAIAYYVYSVIAHIRVVLRGVIVLAESGNIPTAMVACRHVFEWAAQVCYMNENLQKYIAAKDWDAARDLLNQAVIGSRWIKEYGHKYDPTQIKAEDIPNSIRLSKVLASYETHVEKTFGGDTKDDYAHLSEHSHPNSACFQQYHDGDAPGGEIRFREPSAGSPLPVVNWCLIDLSTLLLELLGLSGESTVKPKLVAILKEITQLALARKAKKLMQPKFGVDTLTWAIFYRPDVFDRCRSREGFSELVCLARCVNTLTFLYSTVSDLKGAEPHHIRDRMNFYFFNAAILYEGLGLVRR